MAPDGRAARLLDAAALGLFAFHAALRLSLRGGNDSWGANLTANLLMPMAAAVWLAARALDRRMPWRWTGFEIPIAALGALALVTSLGATFRLGALDGAASLCAALIALPLAVHLFGPERRDAFFSLVMAIVAVVVVYGAAQYVQLGDLQDSPQARAQREAADDEGELEGRMGAREPWSTFSNYSNTFGGFLVLALPFVVGAGLDAKSRVARSAALSIAIVGVFGLWVSGSVGARVAAIGAVATFAVFALLRKRPAWRKWTLRAGGAAALLVAVLVAAGPLSPNALAKRSEALEVRDVYWDAALRVSRDFPWGVGLNNFQDHYLDHKDDRQEEVRNVHNDYLQILVELGVPGLLAFLALFAVSAFKACGPTTSEPAGPLEGMRWPLGIGLAGGWLAAFGFQGTFGDAETLLILAAVGTGSFWLFSRRGSFGDFARIGWIGGLAGAAVHFLVDFDFTDPGYRHFFFLALGGLTLLSRLEVPAFTGAAVPATLAALLFVITLPLAGLVAPRFLEADDRVLRASIATEDADAHLEAAARANRLDAGPAVDRALREFVRWLHSPGETTRAELAVLILEDALRRRPHYAPIEARIAEVKEALARRMTGPGMEAAAAESVRRESEAHARRAVELYPTSAYHRYLLGRILDASGRADLAAAEFREALRLSALAGRVPRLALNGVQAAFATLKTVGDRDRAIALYRDWISRRKSRPGFAERWKDRLVFLSPGEKAIVDAAEESK